MEENANLFRSILEGELTEEQLDAFRTIKRLSRKWVDNEDDSDMEIDDDDYDDADDNDEIGSILPYSSAPGTSNASVSHQLSAIPIKSSNDESHKRQQELTTKYITGELTFTEFTDLLDRSDDEYDEEDEEDEVPVERDEAVENKRPVMRDASEEEEDNLKYEDDTQDEDYVPPCGRRRKSKPQSLKKRSQPKRKNDSDAERCLKGIEDEICKQRKRRKGGKRKQNQLPVDLQGLVGEANLCFARGEHEDAIKMCMEVVRLAPMSPEPFQTLGMIYEELGDMDKSLQFALISAYLSPNDADEWGRLAEMSLERSDIKQALTCYGKAIRCDPTNIDFMWTRCRLYEQLGDKKKTLEQMHQIAKQLKPEDGELGFQVARDIAKNLYDNHQIDQAIATMEGAFLKHPNHITSEDVNLLLELQIKQKHYGRSVQLLCDNCGVRFDPQFAVASHDNMVPEELACVEAAVAAGVKQASSCIVPDVLPIDLCAKLIVCMIHLGAHHLLNDLLGTLLQENLEEMGDLYLDVAEAYMLVGMYKEATPLLASLASSEKYNLAAVWLRYGECLSGLGKLEDSVRAYRHVVELAPSHISARMVLSGLLQQLGHCDEALSILQPDYDDPTTALEPKLLLQRCNLLFSRGMWHEFIQAAKLLHSTHIVWTKSSADSDAAALCMNLRRVREYIKEFKESGQVSREGICSVPFASNSVNPEELWDIYTKMCEKLFELHKFDELELVTKSALTSTVFYSDTEKLLECDFHRFLACYFNKNYEHAYKLIKPYILRDLYNNRVWNVFGTIIAMMQDLRYNRFCLRLMFKNQDHVPLGIINGHSALVSGSYKHALGEYMSIFKLRPKDPLITMCIGLIFVHMTCQKFSGKKHSLVVQSSAFFNRYLELRGECQETYYNLGRAMHQMGLTHIAVYYYKKALEYEPAVLDPEERDVFDLRREIAFNLSLIYMTGNSVEMAKFYIDKYCTV